jgi:hypothetical protein
MIAGPLLAAVLPALESYCPSCCTHQSISVATINDPPVAAKMADGAVEDPQLAMAVAARPGQR